MCVCVSEELLVPECVRARVSLSLTSLHTWLWLPLAELCCQQTHFQPLKTSSGLICSTARSYTLLLLHIHITHTVFIYPPPLVRLLALGRWSRVLPAEIHACACRSPELHWTPPQLYVPHLHLLTIFFLLFFFFFYSFASSLFPAHQFHLLCLFLFFSISSILIFIWNSSPYLPLHLFLFHCLSRPLYLPLIYLHLLSSFLLVLAVLSSFHRCLYLILLFYYSSSSYFLLCFHSCFFFFRTFCSSLNL